MPRLRIDGQAVEVPPGATLLMPPVSLAWTSPPFVSWKDTNLPLPAWSAWSSCGTRTGWFPPAAFQAQDGMEVESETDEIYQVRRMALELLLSDHVGDCLAPCHFTCPAHMDIPLMLRQIAGQDIREAMVTVKDAIPLPAILGRICPKPCEKGLSARGRRWRRRRVPAQAARGGCRPGLGEPLCARIGPRDG